jgi:hypothetical protein
MKKKRTVLSKEGFFGYAGSLLKRIMGSERLTEHMSRMGDDEYARELKALGRKALFVRSHFNPFNPRRATLDNAMIIFGDRFCGYREDVYGYFSTAYPRINGFYSSDSGRIIAFGGYGTVPERIASRGEPFAIEIDRNTGRISIRKGRENIFLRELDGMQIMEV